MNAYRYYQYCVVPLCCNNTKRTPDKIFIPVPRDPDTRELWLHLARKEYDELPLKTTMYFCEDHFDLPNDMENYMEYKIKGSIKKLRMVKNCLPRKFDCQPGRKRMGISPESDADEIKKRKQLVEEILREAEEGEMSEATTSADPLTIPEDIKNIIDPEKSSPKSKDKGIQVLICRKFRSKATQTRFNKLCLNKSVSPIRVKTVDVAVSP